MEPHEILASLYALVCTAGGAMTGYFFPIVMRIPGKTYLVWGSPVSPTPLAKRCYRIFFLGIALTVVSTLLLGYSAIKTAWDWEGDAYTTAFITAIFATLGAMGLCALLGNGYRAKNLSKLVNASSLGNFDVIRSAESQIDNLSTMRFESDRIVLLDRTGYEYRTLFYSNFRMGDLGPDLYYIPSYYFVSKYPNTFIWKPGDNNTAFLIRK